MFFAKCLHRRELHGPRDVRGVPAVCPWHRRSTAERPNRSLGESRSWSKSLPYGPSALPVQIGPRCCTDRFHSVSHRTGRDPATVRPCRAPSPGAKAPSLSSFCNPTANPLIGDHRFWSPSVWHEKALQRPFRGCLRSSCMHRHVQYGSVSP